MMGIKQCLQAPANHLLFISHYCCCNSTFLDQKRKKKKNLQCFKCLCDDSLPFAVHRSSRSRCFRRKTCINLPKESVEKYLLRIQWILMKYNILRVFVFIILPGFVLFCLGDLACPQQFS